MNILNKFKSIFTNNDEIGVIQADVSMTPDEKIGYLANELIKELKASGRSIQCNVNDKTFGNIMVWVFNLGKEDAEIEMYSQVDGWRFKTKPTFKEF